MLLSLEWEDRKGWSKTNPFKQAHTFAEKVNNVQILKKNGGCLFRVRGFCTPSSLKNTCARLMQQVFYEKLTCLWTLVLVVPVAVQLQYSTSRLCLQLEFLLPSCSTNLLHQKFQAWHELGSVIQDRVLNLSICFQR